MGRTPQSSSSSSNRKRPRYDQFSHFDERDAETPPAVEVLIAHDPMLALDSDDDDIDLGELPDVGNKSSRKRRDSHSSSGTHKSKEKERKSKTKSKEKEVVELKDGSDDDEIQDEEVFYVEKIKDKRWNNDRWEYLLAWQGYGPEFDTWEPTENMDCDDLLKEFESQWGRKPKFGYDRGQIPREIVGLAILDKKPVFMVMYKGSDDAEFVPTAEFIKVAPNLVIEFYENRQIGLVDDDFEEVNDESPKDSTDPVSSNANENAENGATANIVNGDK